jgi:hypothetical protein
MGIIGLAPVVTRQNRLPLQKIVRGCAPINESKNGPRPSVCARQRAAISVQLVAETGGGRVGEKIRVDCVQAAGRGDGDDEANALAKCK